MTDTVVQPLPNRHKWRVDSVNNAADAETALRRMLEWTRAELARCEKARPEDADGFRWQIIHLLTPVTAGMYRSHPAEVFRGAPPKLPGGGWVRGTYKGRPSEARHP